MARGTNTLKPWMEILDMHRLPSAICGSFAEIPGVMVIKTAQNMPEILRVRSRLMDRLDCCGQDFRIQFIRLNSISFLEIQIELENILCPYGIMRMLLALKLLWGTNFIRL